MRTILAAVLLVGCSSPVYYTTTVVEASDAAPPAVDAPPDSARTSLEPVNDAGTGARDAIDSGGASTDGGATEADASADAPADAAPPSGWTIRCSVGGAVYVEHCPGVTFDDPNVGAISYDHDGFHTVTSYTSGCPGPVHWGLYNGAQGCPPGYGCRVLDSRGNAIGQGSCL